LAYTYADSRAKHIDFQGKSNYICNRRVLCPHNTDNLDKIKTSHFSIILDLEGVVMVQHPTHKANGEAKINDNALASLALLVATSAPEQKDIIIKLVMNMLVEE